MHPLFLLRSPGPRLSSDVIDKTNASTALSLTRAPSLPQVRALLNPGIRKYLRLRPVSELPGDRLAEEWTAFHVAAWTYFDLLVSPTELCCYVIRYNPPSNRTNACQTPLTALWVYFRDQHLYVKGPPMHDGLCNCAHLVSLHM